MGILDWLTPNRGDRPAASQSTLSLPPMMESLEQRLLLAAAPLLVEDWETGTIDANTWATWGPGAGLYNGPEAFDSQSLVAAGAPGPTMTGLISQTRLPMTPGLYVRFDSNVNAQAYAGTRSSWQGHDVFLTGFDVASFLAGSAPADLTFLDFGRTGPDMLWPGVNVDVGDVTPMPWSAQTWFPDAASTN